MNVDAKSLICDFVDLLLPHLTPYEASLYLFTLRNSVLKNGSSQLRIGKRAMADGYGIGARGNKTNYKHMTEVIKRLENNGCLLVGDTSREGTLYTVVPPREVPLVKKKLASIPSNATGEDFFTEPEKRIEIFERDGWICQYCGERLNRGTATLDHFLPQVKGGTHSKENLRTCCLVCNGVKSGKLFDEAATALLRSIQERRSRIA